MVKLNFGYGNSAFRTYFNASFATQTLVSVYGLGFAVNHLINLSRTSVYTFFIAGAFVFVYIDLPHGNTSVNKLKKPELFVRISNDTMGKTMKILFVSILSRISTSNSPPFFCQ